MKYTVKIYYDMTKSHLDLLLQNGPAVRWWYTIQWYTIQNTCQHRPKKHLHLLKVKPLALHCTQLSQSVGEWAELQTSVASWLASLFWSENEMWTVKVRYGKSPASQRVWKFMSILWAVIAMVKNPIWN